MKRSASNRHSAQIRLRLPFTPLPTVAKAIGLSSRSKNEKGIRWDDHIKKSVRSTYGANCFYCGKPPVSRNHDCHEIFEIDDSSSTIRLVDIVPACKVCHMWADGKIFVTGPLSRALYWTQAELNSFTRKWGLSETDWDVYQYRNMLHFRHVNRITLAKARSYLSSVARQQAQRDKAQRKWRVDYGKWSWAVGLSEGQFYVPHNHS